MFEVAGKKHDLEGAARVPARKLALGQPAEIGMDGAHVGAELEIDGIDLLQCLQPVGRQRRQRRQEHPFEQLAHPYRLHRRIGKRDGWRRQRNAVEIAWRGKRIVGSGCIRDQPLGETHDGWRDRQEHGCDRQVERGVKPDSYMEGIHRQMGGKIDDLS
ncbi:hypothetical protein D9M72_449460 [compost metagenome]